MKATHDEIVWVANRRLDNLAACLMAVARRMATEHSYNRTIDAYLGR